MVRYLVVPLAASILVPVAALGGQASAPSPVRPMDVAAATELGRQIKDQIQPCAVRQTSPGPGAERIRVLVRLSLNRDGSQAVPPAIVGHDGVDPANSRYVHDVDERALAVFKACQPFRGLPPELYGGPHGWSRMTLRFKLPG